MDLTLSTQESSHQADSSSTESTASENTSLESTQSGGQETSSEGQEAPLQPAYTPNFKFKVMDREHEIPEYLRSAIKDADSEKQLRELHEKAFGLDVVKPKFQETRETLKKVSQENQNIRGQINDLREDYRRNDFDSFFRKLQIPEEKIVQWLVDKIQYRELPPEQRAMIDSRKAAEMQARQLETQTQTMQAQYQEQITEAKRYALDATLERSEVKTFAEQFDARAGQAGAFRNAIIETGESAFALRGIDLTPQQAVKEVMDRYGKFLSGQTTASTPGVVPSQEGAGTQPSQHQKAPPVIPNVAGRSTSPTRQRPRNIEDLKKLANSM